MKSVVIFTGTGPILILTTYDSASDPKFVEKLAMKGIEKFIAHELPLALVKQKYGGHFDVVLHDVKQDADFRVLDYNGYRVFHNFSFNDMQQPVYHEG